MNEPIRLGRYELQRELGRGGMGAVYAGVDTQLGRPVAIKRILGHPEPEDLLRFKREASLTSRIEHPGVARVLDVVLQGPGAPFLVLELIEGRDLEAIAREDRLASVDVARILAEVSEAVAAAHDCGVLHRDLKPANVMIRSDGRAVVLDFGLARSLLDERQSLTHTGELLGTAAYMAPEQAHGLPVPASDQYALGGILYFCLTRQPPFVGPSALAILASAAQDPPRRPRELDPDVDPRLERIALRCLEKTPEARFPDVASLALALREVGAEQGHGLEGEQRSWPWAGSIGAALLLCVLGVIALAWRSRPTDEVTLSPTALPTQSPREDRRQPAAPDPALSGVVAALKRLQALQREPIGATEAEQARIGRIREVVEALQSAAAVACDRSPNAPRAHLLRARVSLETLDVPTAIAAARRASELGGGVEALRLLGRALLMRSLRVSIDQTRFATSEARYAEAALTYDALARREALSERERGLRLLGQRRFAEGLAALSGSDPESIYWRAVATELAGKDARPLLRQLLTIVPRHPAGRVLHARVRLLNDLNPGEDMIQLAPYGAGGVWVGAGQIDTFLNRGALVEAEAAIDWIRRFGKTNDDVLELLEARLELSRGQTDAGVRRIEAVLTREGARHLALSILASLRLHEGETEAGLDLLRRAARSRPDYDPHFLSLDSLLIRHGRVAEAVQFSKEMLEKHPRNPTLWMRYGILRGRTGDDLGCEEAQTRALEVLEGRPLVYGGGRVLVVAWRSAYLNRGQARIHLAEAQSDPGVRDELRSAALSDLSKALEYDPKSAEVFRIRASLYLKLKRNRLGWQDMEQFLRFATGLAPAQIASIRDGIQAELGRPSKY